MNQAALRRAKGDETDWSVTRRFRTLPIGSWRRPKADCTDSTGGKVSCHKDQIRGPSILRVNFQNENFIGIGVSRPTLQNSRLTFVFLGSAELTQLRSLFAILESMAWPISQPRTPRS